MEDISCLRGCDNKGNAYSDDAVFPDDWIEYQKEVKMPKTKRLSRTKHAGSSSLGKGTDRAKKTSPKGRGNEKGSRVDVKGSRNII